MPRLSLAARCVLLMVLSGAPARAQEPEVPPLAPEPIGPFVVDARGTMARFKPNTAVASALGVDAGTNLPTRGFGLVVGAHVYPVRRRPVTLGVGGELLLRTEGSRTAPRQTETGPEGPTVTTRMTAVSPQVSLNFGQRNGYSYVSGGIGWARVSSERQGTTPSGDTPRVRTLNYGGGARWFARTHLAFTLDLRFYGLAAQEAAAGRPALPAQRLLVLSAGIGVR